MARLHARAPIRILIADRQTIMRSGVRIALEEHEDLTVVAEAADLESALEAVRTARPDVALVELGLPGAEPEETARAMVRQPDVETVFLCAADDPDLAAAALAAGARAILSTNAALDNLVDAIRSAAAGRPWGPASAETRLQPPEDEWDGLTPREREVAALVSQGMPYRGVATQLGISEHTVKNHLRRIYDKLDINSRVELAVHGATPHEQT